MKKKKQRKINAKKILILILILLGLIIEIKAFRDSRADKILDITVNISDNDKKVEEEKIILQASNNNDSGYSIILPEYIDGKKVNKYFIQQKIVEDQTDINEVEEQVDTEKETQKIVERKYGDKLYLTEEEIKNSETKISVEYDTITENNNLLYNKKLSLKNEENTILSVWGYMPLDTNLVANQKDISNLQDEILEKYSNKNITCSYDIKLMIGDNEYKCKDYNQEINIEFIINQNLKYNVLEIKEEKINEVDKTVIDGNKIKFSVNELKSYILLEEKNKSEINNLIQDESDGTSVYGILDDQIEVYSEPINIENAKLEINDYQSDKNYYLGLDYTENDSKVSQGKYTEDSLKKVTINYYGYDYSLKEFSKPETHIISLNATARRTNIGNVTTSGRIRKRTDTITVTINGLEQLRELYPEISGYKGMVLKLAVPNNYFSQYFRQDDTNTENSSNGKSVTIENNEVVVESFDSSIFDTNSDQCTFEFKISFRTNNNQQMNNISYDDLTVNSLEQTITVGEYTPYGTISDTENQMLISYEKCVPVDKNGNIKIELIDNPFSNRPLERGFNGWITKNTKYANNIKTNSFTYVQTLETNLNNIKDNSGNYVIDLYANWVEANVVFVSSNGNDSNSGKSTDQPITNNWTTINNRLNQNKKTCTNASSREVNIVVLMSGRLEISGLTGPGTPYTLTSLYDGVNYGGSNTYLNVGTTNTVIDSDMQLDYLYVNSNISYVSSGNNDTDGLYRVQPCIYGNMYNLRIGRGIKSVNSNNCTWGQVQGGYYNHNNSEFRLVVESGKYHSILLYRAYYGNSYNADTGATTSTTANGYFIAGSDIDRINNNNDDMKVHNRCASRTTTATLTPYTTNDSKALAINMNIKSGTYGIDYFESQSTADDSERNYAGIYVGGHGQTSSRDRSDRRIIVEGGYIANIIGGLDINSNEQYKTYIYIKDGNVLNITGGAGYTHTYGNRIIQVTGGCIKYSISGGSNGVAAQSSSNNGQLTGKSLIYIGGNAQIGASYTVEENGKRQIIETDQSEVLYGVNAGCVCGGANGNTNYAGQTDGSYIILDGDAVVHNNIYGGGNYGIIGSSGSSSGREVLTFNNETRTFETNKEYLISSSANGGNGLASNNNNIGNETLTTSAIPSNSAKWIFENSGETNKYYIKNVSTGRYLYVSNVNTWRMESICRYFT